MTFQEKIVPLKISNLIRQQFPQWYIEEGDTFISFVEAYYEWMEETGNPLYYARHHYEIKDIDNTLDEFVVYFKEKYLKNIQLDTASSTKLLVKHALDIYRSKGTERCVRLLFQLVFNRNVKFYYPSLDLFKVSDGHWYKPKYLELRLASDNIKIVYKQVQGMRSGASGYVDSVVRRSINNRLVDIAYISAITGSFLLGENVQPVDDILANPPTITGSLTAIDVSVLGTGEGYAVGDLVPISSTYGNGAIGVVTEVIDQFGIVESSLFDGGYGYQSNANNVVYISNTSFTIANLVATNTGIIRYFSQFDVFTQPQAYINYRSATGALVPNDTIFAYYANAAVSGKGVVLESTSINATAGVLLVGVVSGNLANNFYTAGNIVTANLALSNGYFQANATGKFIANDSFLSLTTANTTGVFRKGEKVYQPSGYGYVSAVQGNVLNVNSIYGILKSDSNLLGITSGATCNVSAISSGVGLSNTSGVFYAFDNNIVTTDFISGTISRVELGTDYEVRVANNLLYPEVVLLNSDPLSSYMNTNISAVSYGFPANTSANLTTVNIASSLSFANATIGKFEVVVTAKPGTGYTKPPFIVIDNPIRSLQYRDYFLTISGETGSFNLGDLVTQAATNARGYIVGYDPDAHTVSVQNMRLYQNNRFVTTTNSTTTIVTSTSSAANIDIVAYDDNKVGVMGHNLDMRSEFGIGEGAILTLNIEDSGFGFLPNEQVVLQGNLNSTGIARVMHQGVASGYYRTKGGFTSDQKKLFDGYFWQNYSYQIISSLMMRKYEKMLKQLSHPAGTIMFGQLVHDSTSNSLLSVEQTLIDI